MKKTKTTFQQLHEANETIKLINNSLAESNKLCTHLQLENIKKDIEISELKERLATFNKPKSVNNYDYEIIKTCSKKLYYSECEVWIEAKEGCWGCPFYKTNI